MLCLNGFIFHQWNTSFDKTTWKGFILDYITLKKLKDRIHHGVSEQKNQRVLMTVHGVYKRGLMCFLHKDCLSFGAYKVFKNVGHFLGIYYLHFSSS